VTQIAFANVIVMEDGEVIRTTQHVNVFLLVIVTVITAELNALVMAIVVVVGNANVMVDILARIVRLA
jgi:hypothetical protein